MTATKERESYVRVWGCAIYFGMAGFWFAALTVLSETDNTIQTDLTCLFLVLESSSFSSFKCC